MNNNKREGFLHEDKNTKRYVLNGQPLHCGDCFDVEINGTWVPTRIESYFASDVWYLVGTGFEGNNLEGLHVRR